MYVVLVGVEIWVERDEIEIVDNADTTMNNFLEYRRNHISPKHSNDNAHLITCVIQTAVGQSGLQFLISSLARDEDEDE